MAEEIQVSTSETPAPGPDVSTATPAQAPVSSPAEVSTAPAGQPGDASAQPNPRADIESFASSLGFDPAEFASYQTVDDAKAAVKQYVTHSMKAAEGYDPNAAPAVPAPPQQPFTPPVQQPVPAPPVPFDFAALDLDPESPAAKVISGMSAKLTQVEQTNKAILDQIQNAQRQQQVASYQARRSEADAIVDGFKSPHFGTTAQHNGFQSRNREYVYDIADAIAISRAQQGQPVPPIKQRLAMAKLYFDQEMGGVFSAPTNGSAASVLRESAPAAAAAPGGPGLTEKWSQNPQVRAALGI